MTASGRTAALRNLEFRRLFIFRLDDFYRVWGGGPSFLDRLLAVASASFALLMTWIWLSVLHGASVHWTGGHLIAVAICWLLWGLGAWIPLAMAFRAGLAWPESFGRVALLSGSKPGLALLPVTNRQALFAKLQGRGGAFALALIVGFAILSSARALMIATGAVVAPPPIFDSWLLAAVLLFYALFLVSSSVAAEARRLSLQGASGPALAFVLYAVCLLAGAYEAGALRNAAAIVPLCAAMIAVAATAIALQQSLPPLRNLWSDAVASMRGVTTPHQAADAVPAGRWSRAVHLWTEGWYATAIWGLGGDRGWRTRRASVLALVVGLAGVLTALSLTLQTVSFLWDAIPILLCGGGLAAALAAQDHDAFTFALRIPTGLLTFFALGLPWLAWPEVTQSPFNFAARRTGNPLWWLCPRPHIGILLPVSGRAVWRRRMKGLLVVSLLFLPTAGATLAVTWLYARLLCGPTAPRPEASWFAPLIGLIVVDVSLFAWVAMYRPAARVLTLSGCLMSALFFLGYTFGVTTAGSLTTSVWSVLHHAHPSARLMVLALAAAWLPTLVVMSWVCSPSDNWYVPPDGRAPTSTKIQALLVYLAFAATVASLLALFFSLALVKVWSTSHPW